MQLSALVDTLDGSRIPGSWVQQYELAETIAAAQSAEEHQQVYCSTYYTGTTSPQPQV